MELQAEDYSVEDYSAEDINSSQSQSDYCPRSITESDEMSDDSESNSQLILCSLEYLFVIFCLCYKYVCFRLVQNVPNQSSQICKHFLISEWEILP